MSGVHKRHQFAQHAKFELELDAVDGGFQGGLESVETDVFEDEEGDVQKDHDEVDGDEFVHDLVAMQFLLGPQPEQVDGLENVDASDENFLRAKPGEFHALHDIVAFGDCRGLYVDCAVGENRRGDNHGHSADDNQPEDPSQHGATLLDQMQARIEDKRLAGDHEIPTNGGESDR